MSSTSVPVLNKEIFNPSLYRQIQSVWFEGLRPGAAAPTPEVLKRWWTGSQEDKDAFDAVCRTNFTQALESISPEKFPNPTPEPFLREIHDSVQRNPQDDGAEAAGAALSIILLLDQMSRNIYRANETLPLIYNHYDKIADSFLEALLSSKSPIIRPDLHPQYRLKPTYRLWFYMPLMHTEDLEKHNQSNQLIAELREELARDSEKNKEALEYLDRSSTAGKHHYEILEKFGRYPHRNGCLGRESTIEEKKHLEDGGATFGVTQK